VTALVEQRDHMAADEAVTTGDEDSQSVSSYHGAFRRVRLRGMRALPVSLLAAAVACGGSVKKPTGPSFAKGQKVRISDGGQIYDALNTTACIAWPSPEVKHRAGKDGWNGWDPDTGTEGEVIAQLSHCDHRTQVVLVEVAGYVVPVTSGGVEEAKAVVEPDNVLVGGGSIYGGDPYGGMYGGDPYGGTYGSDYDGDIYGVGSVGYYAGDSVRIISLDGVYSTINTYECLVWPSDDAQKAGGEDAWGGWTPNVDDIAQVLAVTVNCNDSSDTVLIVDDGGMIVPISAASVEPYY